MALSLWSPAVSPASPPAALNVQYKHTRQVSEAGPNLGPGRDRLLNTKWNKSDSLSTWYQPCTSRVMMHLQIGQVTCWADGRGDNHFTCPKQTLSSIPCCVTRAESTMPNKTGLSDILCAKHNCHFYLSDSIEERRGGYM